DGALVAPGAIEAQTSCQTCDPARDRAAWSPASDGTACGSGAFCESGDCQTGCLVGGAFYPTGQPNPQSACQACQPSAGATSFAPLTGIPAGSACDAGQVCASGACASGCYIGGAFVAPGARSPGNSGACCSPAATISNWTPSFAVGP